MNKIRIGVLMGGKSCEREVSFNSGRTICDYMDTNFFDVVALFATTENELYILPWNFLHRGKISDFEHRLVQDAEKISWDNLKDHVDFIYIAQHGRYAEDGCLQGFLDILQIPYHGSDVYASAIGMNKIFQKSFLRQAGIKVPQDIIIDHYESPKLTIESIKERLSQKHIQFPCIVKPACEGSSFGVSLVKNEDTLLHAVEKAMHINAKPQSVLIEEKIDGMEFSCIVIGQKDPSDFIALSPTEIIKNEGTEIFDYEHKYMPGKSLQYTPARCEGYILDEIKKTCINVAKTLGFKTLGRIDGFLTPQKEIVIIDPNSFSGAAPSSFMFKQAAYSGMHPTKFIHHMITTDLKAHGMKEKLYAHDTREEHKKTRIAVIMGGTSHEREISLESGRNVALKLSAGIYQVMPLFLDNSLKLYRMDTPMLLSGSTAELQLQCTQEKFLAWQNLPAHVDFVFNALHGGVGENGSLQGTLELLDMPYNGSGVFTSALCMDKFKTNSFLKQHGFEIPKHILLEHTLFTQQKEKSIQTIETSIGYPCIVKPHDDGCSVLVHKAHNQEELLYALDTLYNAHKNAALVEEYIQGMELTGGVIGNQKPYALPPSYAVAQKAILSIEEKFLPGAGENQTPAPLPAETLKLVRTTLESVYKTIGAQGYVRIDCFYQNMHESPTGNERVVILEVNTLPALTPATCLFHQASEIGLKPMDFIDLIIHLGFQAHKPRTYTHAASPTLNNLALHQPMIADIGL